jgi:hypothetical protein
MFGSFMNVFFVPLLKVDCVVITDLLDERVLVGGAIYIYMQQYNLYHLLYIYRAFGKSVFTYYRCWKYVHETVKTELNNYSLYQYCT